MRGGGGGGKGCFCTISQSQREAFERDTRTKSKQMKIFKTKSLGWHGKQIVTKNRLNPPIQVTGV